MSIKTKLSSYIGLAVLFLLLQSCALMKDHIDIACCPTPTCTIIEGAQYQNVEIIVFDKRLCSEKVGCKKNGYGMEMAAIVTKNDVTDVLQQAIEAELQGRGFSLCKGQKILSVNLMKFNNDFKMGFFCGSSEAESILNIQLKNQANKLLYSNTIIGNGRNKTIFLASGKNAKVALDSALQDAIYQLMNDPCFINSLLE